MTVSGILKVKNDTVVVSEKFSKREFVVETSEGMYPQLIIMQLTKDKCPLLDPVNVGDTVNVEVNLLGREWTSPQGEVRYFNTLDAWRINVVTDSANSAIKPNAEFEKSKLEPVVNPANAVTQLDPDDLPFG